MRVGERVTCTWMRKFVIVPLSALILLTAEALDEVGGADNVGCRFARHVLSASRGLTHANTVVLLHITRDQACDPRCSHPFPPRQDPPCCHRQDLARCPAGCPRQRPPQPQRRHQARYGSGPRLRLRTDRYVGSTRKLTCLPLLLPARAPPASPRRLPARCRQSGPAWNPQRLPRRPLAR